MIIAAKTGPPALPVKPKFYPQRYGQQQHQLPPFRQYYTQQQQPYSPITIDTQDGDTNDDNNTNKSQTVASPSSMLHIPAMISRTTTGNSSVMSSTSTSSQNSSSTNSKRAWHISSWFSSQQQHQQQLDHENLKSSIRRPDSKSEFNSISPQITGSSKRQKVIQELVETEKAYQKDMLLLKEIYYDQANVRLSKPIVRLLFSNLLDIVEFEKSFVSLLEHSCEQDSIGTAFRETVSTTIHCNKGERLNLLYLFLDEYH